MNKFLNEQDGSVAILFAFLLLPLIAFVGLAIDTTRAHTVRAQIQYSLDSAALAGGRLYGIGDTERNDVVRAFFIENLNEESYEYLADAIHIVENDGEMSLAVDSSATLPTAFSSVIGVSEMTVGADAKVQRSEGATMASVFALDVSGSMGWGNKLPDLRQAIRDYLDIVYPDGPDNDISTGVVKWNTGVTGTRDPVTDPNIIKSYINGLSAGGGTASTPGVTRAGVMVKGETDKSIKSIIVMTDGNNNNGAHDTLTVTECNKLKAEGIVVYTVGFGTFPAWLTSCASPGNAFFASNGDDLSTAFESIASDITALVLKQ